MDCVGFEESLFRCDHLPPGDHNCVHAEDASVMCSEGKTLVIEGCVCSCEPYLHTLATEGCERIFAHQSLS